MQDHYQYYNCYILCTIHVANRNWSSNSYEKYYSVLVLIIRYIQYYYEKNALLSLCSSYKNYFPLAYQHLLG